MPSSMASERTFAKIDPRRSGCAMPRRPVGAEPRLEADRRHRAVEVVLHVLFTGPDQLDGPSVCGLGGRHRLPDIVVVEAAPKAAAQEAVVDVDILRRHAGTFGRGGERAFRILRAEPQVHAIGLDARRAVHRLHGGVGQVRHLVDRVQPGCRLRHGRVSVPVLRRHRALLLQRLTLALPKVLGADAGVLAEVPLDGHRLERALRRQKLSAITATPSGTSTAECTPGRSLIAAKS